MSRTWEEMLSNPIEGEEYMNTKWNEYFKTDCTKCESEVLVRTTDKSEDDYYLCGTCAASKFSM